MDFRIALDKANHILVDNGTTIQSRIIYIQPGNVGLLSLYNMTIQYALDKAGDTSAVVSKSCLTLKKMSFGEVKEKDIEIICGQHINIKDEYEKLLKNRRVFSEPVYQCGSVWAINPCNNYVLIPIPGFYVLETKELDQLDTMYVEYATLPATQAIAIPDGFKLGA